MKFGDIKLEEAGGAILGHSVRAGTEFVKKGACLDEHTLVQLKEAGIKSVLAAVPEAGDIHEDEAAARLADALCGQGLQRNDAMTGRANLTSTEDGLVMIDYDRVNRINILDERVTVATLPPTSVVSRRQLAATIKIIPYFIDDFVLDQAIAIAEAAAPVMRVRTFEPQSSALLMTSQSGTDTKLLDKGKRSTGERLARYGSVIDTELRVQHRVDEIANGLKTLARTSPDLIFVLGASAIADRSDVVPSAILEAGGRIEHFGMPVDPGNLLMLGRMGQTRVVCIPGCARSPKLNGFDWVLERLHAGLDVTSRDISRMGVGGLLKEIPSRPQPREARPADEEDLPRNVYAIVLAAGQSRRMGKQNKLLASLDGKPLVRHVVDALSDSAVSDTLVVTGHQKGEIESHLADTQIKFVHNPGFASGLSSSLKAGITALPEEADAVLVCLGDMPLLTARQIDDLIDVWRAASAENICVPAYQRKAGNPILWPRRYFPEIMELKGDVGARSLVGLHSDEVIHVPVTSDSILIDVDTKDALQDLQTDPSGNAQA